MSYPWVAQENFEDGTRGIFDAETDTDSKLDFPHYSTLAQRPGIGMPWRGAYCMRIDLAGGTADAYVQETGSFDIAADGTLFARFMFWFGGAPTMANDDLFAIFQLWSATNTVEGSIGVQYTTASGYRLFVNEAASATSASFLPLALNQWNVIEMDITVDDGASNDGVLTVRLNGASMSKTGLDQGAITSAVLGAIGIDAGTTKGVLLFDDLVIDDAALGLPGPRFGRTIEITKSQHVLLGPGCIENVTLLSGAGTDCVLECFDTDVASTSYHLRRVHLNNTANNETVDPAGMPAEFQRGCYVRLTGTTPRAIVQLGKALMSEGAIRAYAAKRVNAPGGI